MSEFKPVSTKEELALLDEDDVIAGYMYGFDGGPEPGNDKSRSFWHGWRNGSVDGGHRQIDDDQTKLAREYHGRYKGLH